MIVYRASKSQFQQDVFSNRIADRVQESMHQELGFSVSRNEFAAWENSLPYMERVIDDEEIPGDVGVGIEFKIPNSAKRIDFLLTGKRADGKSSVVIVELKQWEKLGATSKDAIVETFIGGCERETSHPSYQAWSYAMLIEDYNEAVRDEPIFLHPCAYLHNCVSNSVINNAFYAEYTEKAPAFIRSDAARLQRFIKKHLRKGDGGESLVRIDNSRIRPSKNLADHLASLLTGNREFYMIDDQKLVYETALDLAGKATADEKQVLIVRGGPGTGKSVVAVNLLVELIKRDVFAQYVTKNAAPRAVYESKLVQHMRKSRISNLFVGSGGFHGADPDSVGALIVDESHRLNAKSGMFQNKGENQIMEIIRSSLCSVFFIDESQQIHWKDIGDCESIRQLAKADGAQVTELELASQFRCNGSDGYLAWLDHTLGVRRTANEDLAGIDYDLRVCETASELRNLIEDLNAENNKARMVAGYCWRWKSKKEPHAYDIEFSGQNFRARWNLSEDGSLWIVKPESVKEVGCIHTCQGLELDYVGVIFGDDLLIRDGQIVTDGSKRDPYDSSIRGYKGMLKVNRLEAEAKADLLIKNTYRTLMTRGQKGCFIYSRDPETLEYFRVRSRRR